MQKLQSVWSRHSYFADSTTATRHSQACLLMSRLSDRCSVYRTLLLVSLLIASHITPVLMRLHWLPIKSRITYKLCLQIVQMHLIHTNLRPDYMGDKVTLIATSSSRPGLRFAGHLLYRKPALKTMFGERAFSYAGPAAWNSLPFSRS